jgi:uncharacterized membrane protein YdbT with pleckstrin-like domain
MNNNPYPIQIGTGIKISFFSFAWTLLIYAIIGSIVFLTEDTSPIAFILVLLLLIVINSIGIFISYLYLNSLGYSLEQKTFIFKGGIISRFEKDLPFSKIQHVILYESFLQRLFGLASVSLETARESGYVQNNSGFSSSWSGNTRIKPTGPLIPHLKKEDALKLRQYVLAAMSKSKPVAGI